MDHTSWLFTLSLIIFSVDASQIYVIDENPAYVDRNWLFQPRQKRGAKDECCKGCPCDSKQGKSSVQPNPIVVNHYHNYYYCCPSVPDRIPQLAPQIAPTIPSSASTTKAGCVDCTCDSSGAISCNVPQDTSTYPRSQQSTNTYQQNPQYYPTYNQQNSKPSDNIQQPGSAQTPHNIANKDKDSAFSFSMMFDDPVAKDFYKFVTDNFVKRIEPIAVTEIQCKSDPSSVLEDPVCKEFFDLFTQTFVRKQGNATAVTEPSVMPTRVRTDLKQSSTRSKKA